jgi:hypothetical protein
MFRFLGFKPSGTLPEAFLLHLSNIFIFPIRVDNGEATSGRAIARADKPSPKTTILEQPDCKALRKTHSPVFVVVCGGELTHWTGHDVLKGVKGKILSSLATTHALMPICTCKLTTLWTGRAPVAAVGHQ